jgi:hypothetical protein
MIVKLFSEKISPAVHDASAKREGFQAWKDEYYKTVFNKREWESEMIINDHDH